ncbi:MAG: adenylate/guanylate cyclase domain-containing protein [Ectothiorhodospiraceae bacterium]|nr:adenylate/guanylate cyclase domain-containing protein [Chromatiales bacterium]MCP5156805.1 adenylate/guanylate cyclase domain-containing protein [Ectothiorhodospiraceae bacterium]
MSTPSPRGETDEARRPQIPARLRRAIAEQQRSSEILIGWVQLAVVCAFAVLYALSPKPYVAEPVLAPEPWVLGIYVAFTLGRLWLAHRRSLPEWLLHLSVVVDMGLLLGLIWSIHIKYAQPASFYLKVPTLLYVFIFIALRALRFEVRYVLMAGGVAAAGWLLMVWYVVSVDPANPMVTRDYVQYMTSNSVLLGAEFDKVISIVLVTAILAVAIARARKLMVRAVVDQAAAIELSRFVPDAVVAQVTAADERVEVGQGEQREATVLFTDIEGFTTLSEEVSPSELIAILNAYFAVVTEPLERHGGVINQFQGDAILATFNLPSALPDHAAAALAAALEIRERLDARTFGNGIRLRSRVGINTGPVIGGLVGTSGRLGYTVHGDAVNLAARLEALNKEMGTRILVSARTAELAGAERFGLRALGTVQIRGRRQSVSIFTPDPEAG